MVKTGILGREEWDNPVMGQEPVRLIGRLLEVNIDKLVGAHMGIVANAGAGKTGAIRKLLEQTHGVLQHIVLDVEDDFYTLREKFAYLIAGGDNGDCPATPKNAKALAEMLMGNPGISAIIQLNDLPFDDQQEFISTFLQTMMAAPRDQWHPLLLVLDEAHRFAPQDGGSICGSAVHDLTARGRKRGFTAVLATQRMAKIDKNVTGDINNWLMGRVGQATDRRVAADALGFGGSSAEARGLTTMANREFYAYGVALCPVPMKVTIGETETTMIRAGEAPAPTAPPPAAMKKMLAALAKIAREAEAQERATEAASRAARSHMSVEDDEAPAGATEAELAAIRRYGFDEGVAHEGERVKSAFREMLAEVGPLLETAVDAVRKAHRRFHLMQMGTEAIDAGLEVPEALLWEVQPAAMAQHAEEVAASRRVTLVPTDKGDTLNFSKMVDEVPAKKARAAPDPNRPPPAPNKSGALRLLNAAGKLHPVKMNWGQLCTTIQIKARGGNFNSARKAVLEAGWLEEQGDQVVVTEAGLQEIGWVSSGKSLLEVMLDALPTGSARLLRTLLEEGGPMSPDDLAAAHGVQPRGGNWNTAIALLRNNNLIVQLANKDLDLAPSLRQ